MTLLFFVHFIFGTKFFFFLPSKAMPQFAQRTPSAFKQRPAQFSWRLRRWPYVT